MQALVWGLCVALGASLAGGAAQAVSIGSTLQLPVDAGTATTVDLGAAPAGPGAGFPDWERLHPNGPADPLADFVATLSGSDTGAGSGTPGDAWVYDITFDFTWSGTLDGSAPGTGHADQILFTIVDSRFGAGGSISGTSDLPQSGFVPGSFEVDGADATPEIVMDDTGAMSGSPEGFVTDVAGNRWLGFWLPADDATHTITMQWALGQMPTGPEDSEFFLPTASFMAVPEPATAALLGAALALGLGVRARRRVR